MGPPCTRNCSQPDNSMFLRSSVNQLSRTSKLRTLPSPSPNKQSSPSPRKQPATMTNKKELVLGPSWNSSSAEHKATPIICQGVSGSKLSFGTPTKDLPNASSNKTNLSPSEMKEKLRKMFRDGSILQPRLILKRLRECDIEGPHKVKRPCLNDDHQMHTQAHKAASPAELEDILSPSPPPVFTSNSILPQMEQLCSKGNTTQSECKLTHTTRDLTLSAQLEYISTNMCKNLTQAKQAYTSTDTTTHTSITRNSTQAECKLISLCANLTQSETKLASMSTNSTQFETKPRHTSIDLAQLNQNDTSTFTSQPAPKPTCTLTNAMQPTSKMIDTSKNFTHTFSRPTYHLTHSTPSSFPNQGQRHRPLQLRPTFSPTQLTSRQTFTSSYPTQAVSQVSFNPTHPTGSSAPRHTHTSRPVQLSLTPLPPRAPTPTFPPPRHSHSPGNTIAHHMSVSQIHSKHTHTPSSHSSIPGNTYTSSNMVPGPSATFTLTPVNSANRPINNHLPLNPVFRPIQPHPSSPIHTPTNSVSRPIQAPTKTVSTVTKTTIHTNSSRVTETHTPAKSTLIKVPILTNYVSKSTGSLTPTKQNRTPNTNRVPAPGNTSTNTASGPAHTHHRVQPFFQPRQTHARPLRHLATNSPSGLTDAKRCCVSSSSSGANSFSPPKYVQCAFMKSNKEGVVMLKERRLLRMLPLSEPSPPSSSSSSCPSLPPVSVRNSAKKLFCQVYSKEDPGEARESSSPLPSPLSPLQPSEVDPSGSGPVKIAWSPSRLVDNLDELLIPASLPASAGINFDTASPEASQDTPAYSTSHMDALVGESEETTVTTAQADVVSGETSTLKSATRNLKVEPNADSSLVCTGQDSFSRTQAPAHKASQAHNPKVVWVDPLEDELGLGDGLDSLDCSLSDTSSSEDEKLLSLQEIMERSVQPPPTPDKEAFPEPKTPVAKAPIEPIKGKSVNYKNTLEQMLIEKEQNQKSKELEEKLLQGCQEDLLMIAEEEEEKEGKEEAEEISQEQHKFVQRYTLTASTIRDLHPGEEIFSLTSFGRLFTQDNLQLPSQGISFKNTAQRTLLRASPKQALLLVRAGLLKWAYASFPCQPEVSRWLLQMMSVHSDPCMSAQILQALKQIALIAGLRIAESQDPQFQVWVPRMQDVVLVFLNMGVPFINMFPLEMVQPPFTEADLLGSAAIGPEGGTSKGEHTPFPEHNFNSVVKYLSVCSALCPRAYSDRDLMLLLTLVCRLSLDIHLQLLPTTNLSNLMLHLISNFRDWDTQLPLVCRALTGLTEDHHNLRRLVQLLPPTNRGRQLRRHFSLSIISKLLNQRFTYKPASTEFQLSDLRQYIPRMRPSLLKGQHIAKRSDLNQDEATLDQQAYYLCYSLLDLTNEASNYEFLRPDQKNQLKLLSAQLEKHVKCDIRETEKCLYRSKVKDYVARIYTRWQVLLQRTRPAQGKLYDFWEPLSEDVLSSSQEEQQDQRRPQSKENVHEDKEIVIKEPEEMAEEDSALDVGRDECSGDKTVIEEETMMEEQPKKEGGLNSVEGQPTEGEELQVEVEPDSREEMQTVEVLDKLDGQPTKEHVQPTKEGLQLKEDPERREEQPAEEALAKEDEEEMHQDKEALMVKTEIEVELHREEEQVTESRMEVGEKLPSKREGVQVEEVEMKETGAESPEQKEPNTDEPMTTETEEGERSVGKNKPGLESELKVLDMDEVNENQVMDTHT